MPGTKTIDGTAKKERKAPRPKSIKAGLTFPVGRCNRMFRTGRYCDKIGAGAGVYAAAILEYLCSEICDLAG